MLIRHFSIPGGKKVLGHGWHLVWQSCPHLTHLSHLSYRIRHQSTKGDSIMGNHPHLSGPLLSWPICSPAYLTLSYLAQPLSSFLFIYHYCQFCFVCPQKCHPFALEWDCDNLGSSGNAPLKWHLESVWVISVSLAIRWVSRLFC